MTATSTVEVDRRGPAAGGGPDGTRRSTASPTTSAPEMLDAREFCFESPWSRRPRVVRDYAEPSFVPGAALVEVVDRPDRADPRRLRLRPRLHHGHHTAGRGPRPPAGRVPGLRPPGRRAASGRWAWPPATSAATWRRPRRRGPSGWSGRTPRLAVGVRARLGVDRPRPDQRPDRGRRLVTIAWGATTATCRRSRGSSSVEADGTPWTTAVDVARWTGGEAGPDRETGCFRRSVNRG